MSFVNTVDIIGDEALTNSIIDRSITEIADNLVTDIGLSAFQNCSALTTVNFQAVTSIGDGAFQACSNLTAADFPAATSIGYGAFQNCSALTTVNFPAATSIDSNAFLNCSALTTVNFPAATSIGQSFGNCSALTAVDFHAAVSIRGYSFSNCPVLTAIILRSETMCTLGSAAVGGGSTPFASGAGYIYVPRALVDSYKAATNWSNFASQFRALEDYTVDGTITGELDSTKI